MSHSVSQRRGRGSKSRISEAQKKELLILCHDWIKWGYNLVSCEYVTRLANALLERDWKLKGEPPGVHLYGKWGYEFRDTHPSFKKKFNQARKTLKALKADEELLTKEWVANVRSLCNQYDINPENMHTVREIGYFTSKNHHTKAVTLRRPRNPSIDLRPMASAIHSFSGTGVIFAPWAMFKEENPSPYETLAGVHIASNKTGWGTQYDWKKWLINHFEPKTRQWDVRRSIWRLMLVDSYHCPIHEDFFLWCRDHKILCISYPRERRDDLNPFHWGVFKTIEREYKRWLYMRWKTELEKNNNDSCRDNASGQVIVKRREFAGILTKITVAGSPPRVAQRKAEAENAWRTGTLIVISNASTGALINRFEDTQGPNIDQLEDGEREDDYFIVDDKEDFLDDVESSSHTVGNSVYSDEEDTQSSSSESDDSADDSYDDCSYTESPVRGRSCSRVAETPFATARVTRSQSRARSVALTAASRASSPDRRRRRSPSPVRLAYRERGRPLSRPELETPSRPYVRVSSRPANVLLRSQPEHSRRHFNERANLSSPAPGLTHSFTGSSPMTGSSSVAVHSSPSFSPGSDLIPSLNTTRKRTLTEIVDNHERAVKALKVLPADERKVHEQFLMDSLRAQILTSG